jgi:hypothetical protein
MKGWCLAADLRDGALKLLAGRKQHRLVRVGY